MKLVFSAVGESRGFPQGPLRLPVVFFLKHRMRGAISVFFGLENRKTALSGSPSFAPSRNWWSHLREIVGTDIAGAIGDTNPDDSARCNELRSGL